MFVDFFVRLSKKGWGRCARWLVTDDVVVDVVEFETGFVVVLDDVSLGGLRSKKGCGLRSVAVAGFFLALLWITL